MVVNPWSTRSHIQQVSDQGAKEHQPSGLTNNPPKRGTPLRRASK